MSTRQQRRDWQEFREKHGATLAEFKQRWRAMFNREPNETEVGNYVLMRRELRAPLGRKKRPEIHYMTTPQQVTATRRYEWDMGHRLPGHQGQCFRLHGHRYVAEIDITSALQTAGPSAGMVLDFSDLDKRIRDVIGHWDHRTMLHVDDPLLARLSEEDEQTYGVMAVTFIPTAENLCIQVMELLELAGLPGRVTRVRIYETPKGWAEVRK